MTDIDWQAIHKSLKEPFPDDEVGEVPINKEGTLVARYINARSVMERLDDVVGPDNWSDRYEKWDDGTCAVLCTLTVHGISRQDVGYPNDPSDADNAKREPFKAACSDALKRAAVHWGIGRYLYPKPGEKPRFASENTKSSGGNKGATEKQVKFLTDLARNYGVPLPNGGNLDGLPMDVAKKWIDELQSKRGNAELTGWGQITVPTGRIWPDGTQDSTPESPQASTFKPSSANQIATIVKLSRLIGQPEDAPESMSSAEASERITVLSHQYNEMKGQRGRSA